MSEFADAIREINKAELNEYRLGQIPLHKTKAARERFNENYIDALMAIEHAVANFKWLLPK
jgi:hypothetical protein